MNKFITFSLLICLLAAFTFQSCSKKKSMSDANLKHIPSNAVQVATMNLANLYAKSDWNTLYQKMKTGELLADIPVEIQTILENPAETGIDMNGYLTYFTVPSAEFPQMSIIALMNIGDMKKFETTIKDLGKPQSKQNYTMINADEEFILAWDKNIVAFCVLVEDFSPSLDLMLVDIFNGPKSNITLVDNFNKHYITGKDLSYYQCYDSLFALFLTQPGVSGQVKVFMPMLGLTEDMFYNNVITSFGEFENGRFYGENILNFNTALVKKFGSIFNNKLTKDYSQYISPNSGAGTSIALNIAELDKLIRETIKTAGPIAAMGASAVLETPEYAALTKGLNGDILVTYNAEKPDFNYNVILGLNDLTAAKTFLLGENLNANKIKKVNENEYQVAEFGYISYIYFLNDVVIISNNEETFRSMIAGNNSNIDKALVSNLNSGVWNLYISEKTFQSIVANTKTEQDVKLTKALQLISKVEINTIANKTIADLSFHDKSKNSLSILLNMIVDAAIEAKKSGYSDDDYMPMYDDEYFEEDEMKNNTTL